MCSSPNTSGGRTLRTLSCRAGRTDEHPALAHRVLDGACERWIRLLRAGVAHELDADQQAHAADVADRRMRGHERGDRGPQGGADPGRPLDQPFVLDDVEHRERRRARDRVAAERGEALGASRRNDRRCSRRVITAATGWPFPIGLPIVTMSGRHFVRRERPQPVAGAPVPDLHLVGHIERPDLVREIRQRPHIRGRHREDPVGREAPVDEGDGGQDPAFLESLRRAQEVLRRCPEPSRPDSGPTDRTARRAPDGRRRPTPPVRRRRSPA